MCVLSVAVDITTWLSSVFVVNCHHSQTGVVRLLARGDVHNWYKAKLRSFRDFHYNAENGRKEWLNL